MTNAELKIIRGLRALPGDTTSAEAGQEEINLLDERGFSQTEFNMSFPALKSSAVYADSPLTDGRVLQSGVVGNVTETIRVTLQASTIIQLAAMMKRLAYFAKECRDYWQLSTQIEPVYLKHMVVTEPGPRYALLYNIEFAETEPNNPGDPIRDIVITLEREPYWRGVAPGLSPKYWTAEFRNGPALNVNNDDMNATSPAGNLFYGTFNNRAEYGNAGRTTMQSTNYVEIPAADIPGDAPALLQLNIQYPPVVGGDTDQPNAYLGTRSLFVPQGDALTEAHTNTINAVDMTAGTGAAGANDTGGVRAAGGGTARRVEITPASTAMVLRLYTNKTLTPQYYNRWVGRWMIFLRCRQNSGSAGDFTMYLRVRHSTPTNNDTDGIALPIQRPQVISGTGNTTAWGLSYMGELQLPLTEAKAIQAPEASTGLTFGFSLHFGFYAARSTGSSLLYVSDFIFIPIDETVGNFISTGDLGVSLDSTGYAGRGLPGTVMNIVDLDTEYRGTELTLEPGKKNRIYYLGYDGSTQSKTTSQFAIVGNIVPRWTGLRDV